MWHTLCMLCPDHRQEWLPTAAKAKRTQPGISESKTSREMRKGERKDPLPTAVGASLVSILLPDPLLVIPMAKGRLGSR